MHLPPDRLLVAGCVGPREVTRQTIDREKVLAILQKRFPGATPEQIAAAANALVSLKTDERQGS